MSESQKASGAGAPRAALAEVGVGPRRNSLPAGRGSAPDPRERNALEQLSLPELIGQLLVVGFDGTSLPGALREDLARGRRGGVIVFKRNITELTALQALCA